MLQSGLYVIIIRNLIGFRLLRFLSIPCVFMAISPAVFAQQLSAEISPQLVSAMAECESGARNNVLTGSSLGACDVLIASRDLDDLIKAKVYTNRGVLHFRRGETTQSSTDFSRAIELDASLGEAWLGLGATQIRAGSAELALESLRQARELNADAGQVLFNQAIAYETLGDIDAARLAYRQANEADPDNRRYEDHFERLNGPGL